MNITDITIYDYLIASGKGYLLPDNAAPDRDVAILSPVTHEKTPSCYIKQNYFKDFSSGVKGGVIAFASLVTHGKIDKTLGAKELYRVFPEYSKKGYNQQSNSNRVTNNYQKKPAQKTQPNNKPVVNKVIPLHYYPLINYTIERKISLNVVKKYLQEIHYTTKGKQYKALCFKNDSDGYVLRNRYIKMNIGKTDITTIIENDYAYIILNSVVNIKKGIDKGLALLKENKALKIAFFEGFFDFLSYKMIAKDRIPEGTVGIFLDNDVTGDIALIEISKTFNFYVDYRAFYRHHKDLNSFIMNPRKPDFEVRDTVKYNHKTKLYHVYKGSEELFTTPHKTKIKVGLAQSSTK